MITTTVNYTEPSSMVAGDNPVVVTLASALSASPGLFPAHSMLNVTGLIRQNFSVNFNFTSPAPYQVSFVSRDFPNKDSFFLSRTLRDQNGFIVTGNTEIQIAGSLADCIQKDVYITQNYFVNYTGGTNVNLLAKSPGTKFEITPNECQLKNEAGVTASSGITLTILSFGDQLWQGDEIDNYSLWVDVYSSLLPNTDFGTALDAGNFVRQTGMMLPFSSPDNKHVFDVHQICKSFLSTTKPDFAYRGVLFQEHYLRSFYCSYGDSYPLVKNTATNKRNYKGRTNYFWALNASLDWQEQNDLTDYTGSTSGGYFINSKFLTNSPAIKKTNRGQKEYLYFIVPKDIATYANKNLQFTCNVVFWDGTTQQNVTLNEYKDIITTGTTLGGCYVADVSYDNIGLDAVETSTGKKIKRAELRIKSSQQSGSTVVNFSETKTYEFPYYNPSNTFGIVFQNRFGTYDSFEFIGLKENTFDRSKKDLTLPVVPTQFGNYEEGFKSSANYDIQLTKKIVVNSGLIDETHFNWIQELFNSTEIYSYTDTYIEYLTLDSYKYSKTNASNEYNVECTFIATLFDNGVTV